MKKRKTVRELIAEAHLNEPLETQRFARVGHYAFVVANFADITEALNSGYSYFRIWNAYRDSGGRPGAYNTFVRNIRKRQKAEASAAQLTPPTATAKPIAIPQRVPVTGLGGAPLPSDIVRHIAETPGNDTGADIREVNPDGPWTREECLNSRGDLIDPITKARLGDNWRFDETIGRPRELTKPEKRERNRARTVNFKQGTDDGFRKPIYNNFQTRAQILGLEKK